MEKDLIAWKGEPVTEVCAQFIGSFLKYGTKEIFETISQENFHEVMENSEWVVDVLADASDVVSTVKFLKKIVNIPSFLFMHKVERYCRGLVDIPIEKRDEYAKKIGETSLNHESCFILNIINKIEEESKLDILVCLFKAKLSGHLDDSNFRRMMIMVGNTLYHDLCYLKEDIKSENFTIHSDEQDGLLGNGWIRPLGSGFGESESNESQNLFAYNRIAKLFAKTIWQSKIDVAPPDDSGMITIATEQEIEMLFN